MPRIALQCLAAAFAFTFAASALAQSAASAPASPPSIALGVDRGNVLVSTGGEFTQAASGQVIAPGHRVLVPEGGSASLRYADGCGKSLSSAGVYTVTAQCIASTSRSGVNTTTVLGVVAGVAVIAAVAGGGGSDDGTPVSR